MRGLMKVFISMAIVTLPMFAAAQAHAGAFSFGWRTADYTINWEGGDLVQRWDGYLHAYGITWHRFHRELVFSNGEGYEQIWVTSFYDPSCTMYMYCDYFFGTNVGTVLTDVNVDRRWSAIKVEDGFSSCMRIFHKGSYSGMDETQQGVLTIHY